MKTISSKKQTRYQPAIFQAEDSTYRADTCEPLKKAAEQEKLHLAGYGRNCYPGQLIPPDIIPELSLYCVWDAKYGQDWGLDYHRNEGIEFGFLSSGHVDFLVEEEEYDLSAGALTITRPWQLHKVGNPNLNASRMHWLIIDVGVRRPNENWNWPEWFIFSENDLEHLTQLLRFNEHPVWQGNKKIERCFENIAELANDKPPADAQTRLQILINELFLEIYELLKNKDLTLDSNLGSTQRSVKLFLEGLKEHLDYPWTLEEMAEHCKLGRSRFTHHCKLLTNMTPANYLTHCRIEKAKEIIKQTPNSKITDIAFSVGFDSSQYFATVFKQKTGKTPSSYKEI